MTGTFKFGFSDSIGTTAVPVSDLAGDQVYATEALPVTVSSTDVDDASGDTGANAVMVSGLDGDFEPISETVLTEGQTGVFTSASFLRVFRARVMTAGNTGANEGTVYVGSGSITSGVPTLKYAAIQPGENQTLMATYSTGSQYEYLSRLIVTGDASKTVTVRLQARDASAPSNPGPWQTKNKFLITSGVNVFNHGELPVKYDAYTDLRVTAEVTSGTTEVSAGFEIWSRPTVHDQQLTGGLLTN